MRYFATVGGAAAETQIEKKVLASNPIMEVMMKVIMMIMGIINMVLLLMVVMKMLMTMTRVILIIEVGYAL